MNCQDYKNYEPKEPKPKYEVGKEYQWTGSMKLNSKIISKPCKVTITAREYGSGHNHWHYLCVWLWINESELSPLPKSKPLYEVGQEYWWSGKRYAQDDEYKSAQKVTIENDVFYSNRHKCWKYGTNATTFYIHESELSPIPKSAHKAGEPCNLSGAPQGIYEYAGSVAVPTNRTPFVSRNGIIMTESDSIDVPALMSANKGFREILIPRRKDRVGESVNVGSIVHNIETNQTVKITRISSDFHCDFETLNGAVKYSGGRIGVEYNFKPLNHHTVHAWDKDGKPYKYSFRGELDLDRVYKETIGEGALAAWIRIGNYYHAFGSKSMMWSSDFFNRHGEKFSYLEETWELESMLHRIQQAVRDYVAKRKVKEEPVHCCDTCQFQDIRANVEPCCPCLLANNNRPNWRQKDKWTRTIGGLRARAYEDNYKDIWLWYSNGGYRVSCDTYDAEVVKEMCAALGIPIKPYVEGEKMERPE